MKILKTFLIISVLVVLGFLFSYGPRLYSYIKSQSITSDNLYATVDSSTANTKPVSEDVTKNDEITLGFVGDIMLDRGVKQMIDQVGRGDFDFPFAEIKEDLAKYDFLFGNLEGPVSNKGSDVGSIYSFRMDPKTIAALKQAGFKAVSVANNHSGDWGLAAFKDTVARLNEAEILPVGDANDPKIIHIRGVKIGLVGFSDFPTPASRAEPELIKKRILQARAEADIVIASFHFGVEYEKMPSGRQRSLAQLAADSGADLIIGHHPHVAEPVELYGNSFIAYSLGNFVFDQSFSDKTMESSFLTVNIKNKKIVGVREHKLALNSYFQPYISHY